VCPTDLQAIGLALDQLGKAAEEVQPLFITVDPERDTPQVPAGAKWHTTARLFFSRWQCPLWVKGRHMQRKKSCPLCPRKRTCAMQLGMSAKGHKRTLRLLDHLIGSSKKSGRDREAECLGGLQVDDIKYFRGNCTGSSDGFAPRRMLSI
jgi:SCO1/SenC